jgi:hypothetical protein
MRRHKSINTHQTRARKPQPAVVAVRTVTASIGASSHFHMGLQAETTAVSPESNFCQVHKLGTATNGSPIFTAT